MKATYDSDHDTAQVEFSRVLKPGGRVAVVWNVPLKTGVPFLEDLERLLSEHRVDYSGVEAAFEEEIYERTETIFGAGGFETARFPNAQPLDFEGLKGLVLSYSNVPAEGDPGSGAMLRDLEGVFHAPRVGRSGHHGVHRASLLRQPTLGWQGVVSSSRAASAASVPFRLFS
jgi:hypothetical protein